MKEIIKSIISPIKPGDLNILFTNPNTVDSVKLTHDVMDNINHDRMSKSFYHDHGKLLIVYLLSKDTINYALTSKLNDHISHHLNLILRKKSRRNLSPESPFFITEFINNRYLLSVYLTNKVISKSDERYTLQTFINRFKNTIIITDDIFGINKSRKNYSAKRTKLVNDIKQTLLENNNTLISLTKPENVNNSDDMLTFIENSKLYNIIDICDNVQFIESLENIEIIQER